MQTTATKPTHNWHVGQSVICIDDSFSAEATQLCNCLPVAGCKYTIREVRTTQQDVALLFEQLTNTRQIYGREPGFWQSRFTPLAPS